MVNIFCRYQIHEIRNLFTKKIKEWFSDVSKNDGKTLEIFCNAL